MTGQPGASSIEGGCVPFLAALLACADPAPPPRDPTALDAVPEECVPAPGVTAPCGAADPELGLVLRGGGGRPRGIRLSADRSREVLGATWVSASPLGEAAAAAAAIDAARLQDWGGYDVLDPGFDDATLTVSSPVGHPGGVRADPRRAGAP